MRPSSGARSAELRPGGRGLALLAAAAAFLAAGILRDNLAFLLWGGSFLFLALLGLAGLLVEGLRAWRSFRGGAALSSTVGSQGGSSSAAFLPGDPLGLAAEIGARPPLLPWIQGRGFRSYARRSSGRGRFLALEGLSLPAPRRGDWASPRAGYRLSDAAGFFSLDFLSPGEDSFLSLPPPLPPPEPSRGGGGGSESRREESFRRSEEFLDSRPYLPGDDARRINWKQYGHSEELFVRQGEPEPPPRSLCLALLDPELPLLPISPRGFAEDWCDAATALCAAWARESAAGGAEILLALPGGKLLSLAAGGSRPEAFLAGLAALPPPPPRRRRSPAEAQGQRAELLRSLLAAAPSAGRRVLVFCAPDGGIVRSWESAAGGLSCRLSFSLCGFPRDGRAEAKRGFWPLAKELLLEPDKVPALRPHPIVERILDRRASSLTGRESAEGRSRERV